MAMNQGRLVEDRETRPRHLRKKRRNHTEWALWQRSRNLDMICHISSHAKILAMSCEIDDAETLSLRRIELGPTFLVHHMVETVLIIAPHQ